MRRGFKHKRLKSGVNPAQRQAPSLDLWLVGEVLNSISMPLGVVSAVIGNIQSMEFLLWDYDVAKLSPPPILIFGILKNFKVMRAQQGHPEKERLGPASTQQVPIHSSRI